MEGDIGIPGVDAYADAIRNRPSLIRDWHSRKGVGVYGWTTGPTKEVHIAETRELILSVHLGGSRRVRVFTEQGLSQSVSKPGDITLIPSGQAVSYRTNGEVEFATVHFPIDAVTRDWPDLVSQLINLPTCLFALHDEYVVASVKAMMRAPVSSSPDAVCYSNRMLDALTSHLAHIVDDDCAEHVRLAARTQSGIKLTGLDGVIAHIEAHIADKLTLNELAEHAGICRSVFAYEFGKHFGCSPHRYVTQRRIERAKALLAQGRLSISDIAYAVGFSGHSHFSTTFKAIAGCVPAAYANADHRS